jgi:hypothetical protein
MIRRKIYNTNKREKENFDEEKATATVEETKMVVKEEKKERLKRTMKEKKIAAEEKKKERTK